MDEFSKTISTEPFTVRDSKTGEETTVMRVVHIHHSDRHPRAEVRDSETGEVIFPAIKGPLVVVGGSEA